MSLMSVGKVWVHYGSSKTSISPLINPPVKEFLIKQALHGFNERIKYQRFIKTHDYDPMREKSGQKVTHQTGLPCFGCSVLGALKLPCDSLSANSGVKHCSPIKDYG